MAPHILQFSPAPPLSKKLLERTDGVESLVRCAKVAALKPRRDVLLRWAKHTSPARSCAVHCKDHPTSPLWFVRSFRLGLSQDHRPGKLFAVMFCAVVRLQELASCAMTKDSKVTY